MNIQPGNSSRCRRAAPKKESAGSGFDELCSLIARVGHAALFILIFGALFHTYIRLNNEINSIETEIRKTDERITLLGRDIEGLQARYALCSSRQFVISQIAKFGLKLEPIRHDQRQVMRMYSREQIAGMRYSIPPRREVAAVDRRR